METKTNSPIKAPFQMSFAEWLAAYGNGLRKPKNAALKWAKYFSWAKTIFER